MDRRIASLAPYLVGSAALVVAKLAGAGRVDRALKPTLLPLLGLRVAAGPRPSRRTGALLGAALTAGWLADLGIDRSLRGGLGGFLVGHLLLIVLFAGARGRVSPWALLLVPWLVGLLAAVRPRHLGALYPVAIGYAVVLGAMAAAATRGGRRTGFGGAFFVASDTLLVVRRFTPWLPSPRWGAAVMGTYLAAQALIVDGVLDGRMSRDGGDNGAPDRTANDHLRRVSSLSAATKASTGSSRTFSTDC